MSPALGAVTIPEVLSQKELTRALRDLLAANALNQHQTALQARSQAGEISQHAHVSLANENINNDHSLSTIDQKPNPSFALSTPNQYDERVTSTPRVTRRSLAAPHHQRFTTTGSVSPDTQSEGSTDNNAVIVCAALSFPRRTPAKYEHADKSQELENRDKATTTPVATTNNSKALAEQTRRLISVVYGAANNSRSRSSSFSEPPNGLEPFPERFPDAVVAAFCALLGADLNACDMDGLTPLYRAASQGLEQHVAMLLQASEIDVNATCGRVEIIETAEEDQNAQNNQMEDVQNAQNNQMEDENEHVEEAGEQHTVVPERSAISPSVMDGTPALVAAFRGHYDILTQLVFHGARLDIANKLGFSVAKLARMNPKVRASIAQGRELQRIRGVQTGESLLENVCDLPVELAALVVCFTY